MADITQAPVVLLAHTGHTFSTTNTAILGDPQDVRSWLSGTCFVYHAAVSTTPIVTPSVRYILQARWDTGGAVNENWIDMITFQTAFSTATTVGINATEPALEKTMSVDADPTGGGMSKGDLVYLQDVNTLADGEWGRCDYSEAAGPTVVLIDGITNQKDEYDVIWGYPETFSGFIDLSGISYVRMIMIHSGDTGPLIEFAAHMIGATDIE